MPKKLTKKIVNERLEGRGIKLVGEYKSTSTKIAFQCAEGHTWKSKPNNILNGNGCPHCSGKALLTKEVINQRIANRGIKLVGDYKTTNDKTTFQCAE